VHWHGLDVFALAFQSLNKVFDLNLRLLRGDISFFVGALLLPVRHFVEAKFKRRARPLTLRARQLSLLAHGTGTGARSAGSGS
jgi:hypothetical protein